MFRKQSTSRNSTSIRIMNKAFVKESDDTDDDLELGHPDVPAGTKNYITPAGHQRLRDELLQLLDTERPEVVRLVSWAASNGDRSENGDYIYGKRRLREIDVQPAPSLRVALHDNEAIFSFQLLVVVQLDTAQSATVDICASQRLRSKRVVLEPPQRLVDLDEPIVGNVAQLLERLAGHLPSNPYELAILQRNSMID